MRAWRSREATRQFCKRYLIFPTGSSFSVAVCMTIGIYGNPQYSIFSWGLNWGFAYNLPTNSSYFKKGGLKGLAMERRSVETKPMMQRSNRKDLYSRLEVLIQNMGYDGRECILRALCEAPQTFGKKGSHLVAEIIRTVFSFPKSKVLPFEHKDLITYDDAHRKGKRGATDCHSTYPNCGFSLIELALGKYSKLQQNFM